LESADDAELIIYIPFTGTVKLKSIMIIGGEKGSSPKKMKVFANRDDIDFSNANDAKPVQEWDLQEDFRGEIEYPTRIVKFSGISSVTIFIPQNFGSDSTTIYYIGLKGEYGAPLTRQAVVTTYEAKPQLKDHKTPAEETMGRQIQ